MSARVHTEESFEDAIELDLLADGWLRGPANYRPDLGLDTGELFTFIGATQNPEFLKLETAYGSIADAQREFAKRLASEIDKRGVLDVLRGGVKDRGVTIQLVYFRPGHTLADGALDNYKANRLTVVRQLRYSATTTDELDLTLFVNGIPVATAELKNPLTGQSVEDAKAQYRRDRDPRELIFAKRTLAHFAVDPDLVFVTTRLAGAQTRFLPFNMGSRRAGRLRRRRQPAERRWRLPHVLPVAADLAAGQLAGTAAAVPARAEPEGEDWQARPARERADLPALPPVARRPGAGRARRAPRCRAQLPRRALGGLGQVEHDRVARPPAVDAARARRPGRSTRPRSPPA